MENRYYVKIRLFDNLPDMPEHGVYKTIMVECDSTEDIERLIDDKFKLKIFENVKFSQDDSVDMITLKLNKILEKMIMTNPDQWIWTHSRWKI